MRTAIQLAPDPDRDVPSIQSLEKWARALRMPLYQVFYEGEEPPKPLKAQSKVEEKLWGNSGREARQLDRLRRLLAKMDLRSF